MLTGMRGFALRVSILTIGFIFITSLGTMGFVYEVLFLEYV